MKYTPAEGVEPKLCQACWRNPAVDLEECGKRKVYRCKQCLDKKTKFQYAQKKVK